jgi:hypothetical protein
LTRSALSGVAAGEKPLSEAARCDAKHRSGGGSSNNEGCVGE